MLSKEQVLLLVTEIYSTMKILFQCLERGLKSKKSYKLGICKI
jgi:hypothetical protein